MLQFQLSSFEREKNTCSTQIRHGDTLASLINEAAAALGVEKSVFLRAIIEREASRVLEARSTHFLESQDADLFAAAMDTPPAPTARALKAAKAYQDRVVRAD